MDGGTEEREGGRGGGREEVRVFGLHLHNRYSELSALINQRSSIPGPTLTHHPPLKETLAE